MVKSPPSSKSKFSAWKKRYFVLYDPTVADNKLKEQTRYLIYYETKDNTVPLSKYKKNNFKFSLKFFLVDKFLCVMNV